MVSNAERDAGDRWPHLSLRAAQFLDRPAQMRLLRLLRWREAHARRADRPRSWILDNELAVLLARDPGPDRAEERRVGESVSVRVDLGGRRVIKKKQHKTTQLY